LDAGRHGDLGVDGLHTKLNSIAVLMRRSLACDQDREMSSHRQLALHTGVKAYFCDPHSPGSVVPAQTPRANERSDQTRRRCAIKPSRFLVHAEVRDFGMIFSSSNYLGKVCINLRWMCSTG